MARASKIMAPTSCFTGQVHRLPDAPEAYGAMITRAKAAPPQSRSVSCLALRKSGVWLQSRLPPVAPVEWPPCSSGHPADDLSLMCPRQSGWRARTRQFFSGRCPARRRPGARSAPGPELRCGGVTTRTPVCAPVPESQRRRGFPPRVSAPSTAHRRCGKHGRGHDSSPARHPTRRHPLAAPPSC